MDEETFQRFFQMLPQRTIRRMTVLHYFLAASGEVHCLDLNLRGASLEEVDRAAVAWITAARDSDILPAAPEADWRNYAKYFRRGPQRAQFFWKHYNLFLGGRRSVEVIVEKEGVQCRTR